MDKDILLHIGLTKGEADVYLALLKLGNTTTGALIPASRVSRSKVYDILDRLKQKGLVTEMTKENTRYFEATSPKHIINYLNAKQQELTNTITEAHHLIPQLEKLQKLQLERQEAKIYVGINGWKSLYDEILDELTPKDEYLAFGIGKEEMVNDTVKRFIKTFHLKRAEKKVPARILMPPETKEQMSHFAGLPHYRYKFTDARFPTNIAIYRDTVITLVWSDTPVAFSITSKQVAKKYRTFFESIWAKARS